jgi:hypothetical protein
MDRYRMALQVFGGFMRSFTPDGDDWTAYGIGAGMYHDFFIDQSGYKMISTSIAGGVLRISPDRSNDYDFSRNLYGYRANLDMIMKIGAATKLFFGTDFNHVIPESDPSLAALVFHYGIRIYGSIFATDIGLIRPLFKIEHGKIDDVEQVMKYMPVGYPFLSFTYKW